MAKIGVMWFLGLIFFINYAYAACPNAATSVTIPLSGEALVVPYDQSCNVLPGTGFTLQQQTPSLANWNAVTLPGFTGDASGLHMKANGASPGMSGTFKATYTNGLTFIYSFVVGASVTSITAGTATP